METVLIISITPAGIKVYRQERGVQHSVVTFFNQLEGLTAFALFLATASRVTAFLMVDVPEEEIKLELVPWVFWHRSALLNQTVDRLFRHPFRRHGAIVGREKGGRRDALALCAALQSGDSIEPWLEILCRAKVPIMAIRSVALLTPLLLQALAIRAQHAIVVTIHAQSGVRQSYLRDGHLAFTRLSPIVAVDSLPDYAGMILQEVAKTTRYLLRPTTGDVPPETAAIWIIGDPELLAAIMALHTLLPVQFTLTGIPHTNTDTVGKTIAERSCADTLFAKHVQRARGSDYRNQRDCRYAINRSLQHTLVAAALLISMLCGATALSLVPRTQTFNETLQKAETSLAEIQQVLQSDVSDPHLAPAYAMRDTVQTFQWLADQHTLPQQLLAKVSHVFADYPLFRLQTVSWHHNTNHAQLIAELAGTVEEQDVSLQAMYTRFHSLVAALRQALPSGNAVESLMVPTDTHTTAATTLRAGSEPLSAPFAIRLTVQAAELPRGAGVP